jgi:hypothetical protein
VVSSCSFHGRPFGALPGPLDHLIFLG